MKSEEKTIKKFFKVLNKNENCTYLSATTPSKEYIYPEQKISSFNKLYLISIFGIFFAFLIYHYYPTIKNFVIVSNSVQYIDYEENNIFMYVSENKLDMLKALFKEYKYIDTIDEYGWTPLHWAVMTDNIPITKLLVSEGADPDIKSTIAWTPYPAGSSPHDIAKINNNNEMIQLLSKQ